MNQLHLDGRQHGYTRHSNYHCVNCGAGVGSRGYSSLMIPNHLVLETDHRGFARVVDDRHPDCVNVYCLKCGPDGRAFSWPNWE